MKTPRDRVLRAWTQIHVMWVHTDPVQDGLVLLGIDGVGKFMVSFMCCFVLAGIAQLLQQISLIDFHCACLFCASSC